MNELRHLFSLLDVLECHRELLEAGVPIVRQHGEVVHLLDQFGLVVVTRSVTERTIWETKLKYR